jgi:ribosomal protein S18 acetylase RimI-like enzyme
MQIRQARVEDAKAVMELVARVVPIMRASGNLQWDDEYPNAAVFAHDTELKQLWVVEIEGRIAGLAAITTDQEPEYAQVGWDITETAIVVHRLAVDPAFHRRGIAAALMLQAEVVAGARSVPILRADTNISNEAAQRLVSKLGYELMASSLGALDHHSLLRVAEISGADGKFLKQRLSEGSWCESARNRHRTCRHPCRDCGS